MSNDSMDVHYTESELELLDANCRTALPFDEQEENDEKLLIGSLVEAEEMGRRAKAKRRAARLAMEHQVAALSSSSADDVALSEETDCEIPSPKTSKIPVLLKEHKASSAKSSRSFDDAVGSQKSKIPRPVAELVYLKTRSELLPTDSSEPTSYTPTSGSFTNTDMITGPLHTRGSTISPLPMCDLSTEHVDNVKNQVMVVAEANGVEMKFDMTAMLSGLDLNLVGLRFE